MAERVVARSLCTDEEGTLAKKQEDVSAEPPLDKKKLLVKNRYGQEILVPAINIGFMEERQFVTYKPPSFGFETAEDWVNRILFITEDLQWVLKLPHHRFWSQAVHDDSLHVCLESYLTYAHRRYDMNNSVKDEWIPLLKELHRLVFMVFLRMSTYKESKCHHITPNSYRDLIYEYFIFDVPKILDLSVVYGEGNGPLLKKMIANVFKTQPKYISDLEKVADSIYMLLCEKETSVSSCLTSLNNDVHAKASLESYVTLSLLVDAVSRIVDTCGTLSSFLDIYPPACSVFHHRGFALRLASFYNAVFPALEYEYNIRKMHNESEELLRDLKCQITFAKVFTVQMFRSIIASCCIQPIIENGDDSSDKFVTLEKVIEELTAIFTTVSDRICFICDYNQLYPMETDLTILSDVCPEGTLAGLKEISECVKLRSESLFSGCDFSWSPISTDNSKFSSGVPKSAEMKQNESHLGSVKTENNCEISSAVHRLLSIFPDYDSGFIEVCLKYYEHKEIDVINAILDDTFPECLKKYCPMKRDAKENFDPPDKASVAKNEMGKVDDREDERSQTPNTRLECSAEKSNNDRMCLYYNSSMYDDEYDDSYDTPLPSVEVQTERELQKFVQEINLVTSEDCLVEKRHDAKYPDAQVESEKTHLCDKLSFGNSQTPLENPEHVKQVLCTNKYSGSLRWPPSQKETLQIKSESSPASCNVKHYLWRNRSRTYMKQNKVLPGGR